jgi:hypothetical protein
VRVDYRCIPNKYIACTVRYEISSSFEGYVNLQLTISGLVTRARRVDPDLDPDPIGSGSKNFSQSDAGPKNVGPDGLYCSLFANKTFTGLRVTLVLLRKICINHIHIALWQLVKAYKTFVYIGECAIDENLIVEDQA